jgi:polyhydroxybutyrate depolymerase
MKRVLTTLVSAALLALGTVAVTAPASSAAPAGTAACSLAPTGGPVSKFLMQPPDIGHYRLTVPPGLSGSVPLLIDLHGGGGNATAYEYLTSWPDYAMRKKNFILAAPDSEAYGFWNFQQGSIDVSFIKALVKNLSSTYCIDPKRIYVSGHSNGGMMTDRMACDAAGTFAAAAPYAGAPSTLFGSPCAPQRAIPIAFFHGDSDTQAPVSVQEQNRDAWIQRQHCPSTASRVNDTYGYTDTYAPCDSGSEIKWRLLKSQSHAWPSGAAGEDMRDRMWAFFNAHPLP